MVSENSIWRRITETLYNLHTSSNYNCNSFRTRQWSLLLLFGPSSKSHVVAHILLRFLVISQLRAADLRLGLRVQARITRTCDPLLFVAIYRQDLPNVTYHRISWQVNCGRKCEFRFRMIATIVFVSVLQNVCLKNTYRILSTTMGKWNGKHVLFCV